MPKTAAAATTGPTGNAGNIATTHYRLDAKNRIIEVGGNWDRFAHENGADDLASDFVIGLPLRAFISGDVTKMFMDTMLTRVRLTGKPAVIPYRCDSPGIKRFMEMSLEAIGTEVFSEHRILAERPMPRHTNFRVAAHNKSCRMIKQCSMCSRFANPGGEPVEPEVAGISSDEPLNIIYFICAECRGRVQARL
jgi:hypothetical protein